MKSYSYNAFGPERLVITSDLQAFKHSYDSLRYIPDATLCTALTKRQTGGHSEYSIFANL